MASRGTLPFVSLMAMCFLFAAQSSKADTITFHDKTESVFVTPVGMGSRLTVDSCSGEVCMATLTAPMGFTFARATPGLDVALLEGDGTLSDGLMIAPQSTTSVKLTFGSDADGLGTTVNCSLVSVVCIPETGGSDLAATILWNGGIHGTSTDNIKFMSDVTETPEPASLFLLGSGLTLAGGLLRRRRRPVTPSV